MASGCSVAVDSQQAKRQGPLGQRGAPALNQREDGQEGKGGEDGEFGLVFRAEREGKTRNHPQVQLARLGSLLSGFLR